MALDGLSRRQSAICKQNVILKIFRFCDSMIKLFQNTWKYLQISKMSGRLMHTVAVCQMTSTADREANFNVFRDLVAEAKTANASMVFFPEGCDYIASSVKESLELAESSSGEWLMKYCGVAKVSFFFVYSLTLDIFRRMTFGCHSGDCISKLTLTGN